MYPFFHAEPGCLLLLQVILDNVPAHGFEELDFLFEGWLHHRRIILGVLHLFFTLSCLRSFLGCFTLYVPALLGSLAGLVEEDEHLQPCDAARIAFLVGRRPLPFLKEVSHLFVEPLAVRELVPSFYRWGHGELMKGDCRLVLLPDLPIALYPLFGIVAQHCLTDLRCFLSLFLFDGGDRSYEPVDSRDELFVCGLSFRRPASELDQPISGYGLDTLVRIGVAFIVSDPVFCG